MSRLAGKVAMVTGAAAGIGRATAEAFAREGARLALLDIDETAGRQAAETLAALGHEALFIPTDVTREDAVRAAVAALRDRFGRLDILFNCAGGSLNDDGRVTEIASDVFDRVWSHTMGLDLRGAMLCCRHAIPEIVRSGGGSVVIMSSGAALRGGSPKHVYTAAKGAVVSLVRALAGTHASQGVRVNAICAGRILSERILRNYGSGDTPGQVVDRQDAGARVRDYPFWVGEPADIAAIGVFLASDESRMITGAALPADGGRSAY
jgi:NAD(P)-dependent dehydrogenase (short-subunit alcohol dehydrogenase family)